MINTLWVDVGYLLEGVVCFDENIVYDVRGSRDTRPLDYTFVCTVDHPD